MNATSVDIKDMLVADSDLGLIFADNLHIGREPDSPNQVTTIYDTSQAPPMLTLDNETGYYYESCQVRVRSTSYTVGYDLIKDIRDSLHGRAGETWNDTLYTLIRCSNGPSMLTWDDNNRVIFIINLEIQRR